MTTLKSTLTRWTSRLPLAGQRPWKVALYLGVFLLPGGTFAVLVLAWMDHQLANRRALRALTGPSARRPLDDHENNGPASLCQDCPAV